MAPTGYIFVIFLRANGSQYVGSWKEGEAEGGGELIHKNHRYQLPVFKEFPYPHAILLQIQFKNLEKYNFNIVYSVSEEFV